MTRKTPGRHCAWLLFLAAANAGAAQAGWVHYDANHTLVYSNDDLGNHLPDFSHAGYEGGGVALPVVPVKVAVSPVGGDNTANIQSAIDTVSALTPDANGFRGAVLLQPGTYTIAGTLAMNASGVVLRGSGDNTNTGTILLVTGNARNVITVSGSGSWVQTGNTYTITDPYVILGATSFHIGGGITWGTNVTISGDADVFTNGTFLYAYDWADSNTTVNGIDFTGTSSANAGSDVSINGIGSNYRNYSSTATPFSALSAAYRSILVGGEYGGPVPATVTLKNLTIGRVYAVQVWVSDPRGGGTAGRTENVLGYNGVALAYNVPPATGGVGQYAVGVFTATANTQAFSLSATNSTGSTELNALLVSDVTATGYQPLNPSTVPLLNVGDTIVVQRPQTQPWINAIGMNLLTNPWTPGRGLYFERQITAINRNQLTIDVPLCNPIESDWTTGQIFQVTDSARIQQAGVEDLCGVGQINDYPSNILSGCFIVFNNIKNGWVQDMYLAGWGSGISLNSGSKWCTVQDCQYADPATGTSSAAPAAYTLGDSVQMCLMQRCTSDGGYYHIMVTQAGTAGPNVFLNFTSTGTHYNGGPHQRWAAGALHDNIVMAPDSQGGYTPYLAINNRGNDGSGQGWAAGFSVMYNCQVPQFQLEQPDTTTNQYNWVIGGVGSEKSYSDPGIYDAFGTLVNPRSLYLEQLRERLGGAAVENIGYTLFTISATPSSQTIVAGTNMAFTVNVGDPTLMSNLVTLSVSGLPPGASADFSTNSVMGAGSATLTVTASNAIAPGNYTLAITGVNAGLTHTALVSLVVQNPYRIPVMNQVALAANSLIIAGTNGTANANYFVLTSTNLALPLANWTAVATNAFDTNGNFIFTNVIGTNARQFYLLQLQ
ncbi:MAG TPA: hypothetical protein VG077_00145 [Verrucomicrobiae bacterium]|nr:hypothetical protein [Verrucomicrobiae bacterium]